MRPRRPIRNDPAGESGIASPTPHGAPAIVHRAKEDAAESIAGMQDRTPTPHRHLQRGVLSLSRRGSSGSPVPLLMSGSIPLRRTAKWQHAGECASTTCRRVGRSTYVKKQDANPPWRSPLSTQGSGGWCSASPDPCAKKREGRASAAWPASLLPRGNTYLVLHDATKCVSLGSLRLVVSQEPIHGRVQSDAPWKLSYVLRIERHEVERGTWTRCLGLDERAQLAFPRRRAGRLSRDLD